MAGTLDGKVAIVTGAGRGLGQVMTLGLLEAGARVAAVEIDAQALEETESGADQRGAGERIQGVVADITRDDSAPKIVRATIEHFGRLDILINNAGINTSLLRPEGQPVGKFWEVTPTEFRRVIDVNVVAVFLMTRAALPVMLKQGWGRIINVTTSLDTMYRANMQPYGGSKAANEAHLLAMAQELEGTGVSANVLVPGGAANTRLVSRAQEPDRAKADPARGDGGAADLAVLERLRRRQRPALHRHALGQKPAARGSRQKRRRADGVAATRPSGDHAERHELEHHPGTRPFTALAKAS